MTSMYMANHFKSIKAIICLNEFGSTALWMSRIKTDLSMIAMSSKESALNLVALYKGVLSAHLPFDKDRNILLNDAVKRVQKI